jgi:hypothetical protein
MCWPDCYTPPPTVITFDPVWDFIIDHYLIPGGRTFLFVADQVSQFFFYINDILVGQSPPNVTNWSYTPPTTPDPSPTPHIVRVVVQNQNGSTEHVRHWVTTSTPVTSKPVPYKVNPTTIELPPIPLNTNQPLSLTVSVDQWSILTLQIDGVVYGTPQDVLTPYSDVIFTIGLDYLNNPENVGEHIIAIKAENSNGQSEAALVYNLNVICPNDCLPLADRIPFQFNQFRVRVNDVWSSWKPAYCYENAIARFGFGSQDKSQFSTELSNFEWRKNDSVCQKCNVCFYNAVGPNQKLYLVSSSFNSHAMVAEFLGRADHFTEDRIIWENWRFFQYSNQQIRENEPDPDINPPFIQMPQGSDGEYNWITIRQVTQIYINDTGGIRYQGVPVAQFTIDELNQVTPKNEPFQDIPLPD